MDAGYVANRGWRAVSALQQHPAAYMRYPAATSANAHRQTA